MRRRRNQCVLFVLTILPFGCDYLGSMYKMFSVQIGHASAQLELYIPSYNFRCIYWPYALSLMIVLFWEKYSIWALDGDYIRTTNIRLWYVNVYHTHTVKIYTTNLKFLWSSTMLCYYYMVSSYTDCWCRNKDTGIWCSICIGRLLTSITLAAPSVIARGHVNTPEDGEYMYSFTTWIKRLQVKQKTNQIFTFYWKCLIIIVHHLKYLQYSC